MSNMTECRNDQLNIVIRNLQEHIGTEKLDQCLDKNDNFNLYWGTAPTGRPHIAYFVPMTKIADFLRAGCSVTILFADLHAYLDNMKAPWELLQKRTEYYEILIKGMLKALNVPLNKLRFIRGTEFQLKENYTLNVFKIIAITSTHDAIKAGCEVVKQTNDRLISAIIYPLLQALDEEFLSCDVQFGGSDQRKIFMYAEKILVDLGFAKRAHLMNPMIPGLTGGKMSASEEDSKIDLLDDSELIIKKLQTAICSEATSQSNGILAFIKFVILPIKNQLQIDLLNKYNSIEEIESDFAENVIDEFTLKKIVENALCSLMKNLKEEFILCDKENLDQEAYPSKILEAESNSKELLNSLSEFSNHLESLISEFPEFSSIAIDDYPSVSRSPKILWSCRASGEPHIGYLLPLRKLANMSNKNWKVVILIEDIGAHLFSHHSLNKPSWKLLQHRAELYRQFIKAALINFNANFSNLEIIFGSEFQLSKEYALILYPSLSHVTERECSEMLAKMVGDQSDITSCLSSVIYPCIFTLDQLMLKPTIRLLGDYQYVDELYQFSTKLSDSLHMNSLTPKFIKHKMISSLTGASSMKSPKIAAKTAPKDTTSISICDNIDGISRKMKKAYFDPKNLSGDPSLNIIEYLIWPSLKNESFHVKRTEENGGDVNYSNIGEIRAQLEGDLMHPGDVKVALVRYLDTHFLQPITSRFSIDLEKLLISAYPPEPKKFELKKNAFNPNNLDIRVGSIASIIYLNQVYKITVKSGLEEFSIERKHIGSFTPNDLCLIAVKPSTHAEKAKMLGILCRTSGKEISSPIPLRLVKKPYNDMVSFENYEVICPHMKENEEGLIEEHITSGLTSHNGSLEWICDGSTARDIEFVDVDNVKIIIF